MIEITLKAESLEDLRAIARRLADGPDHGMPVVATLLMTRERVISTLEETGGLSIACLAARLGTPYENMAALILKMIRRGEVMRSGSGRRGDPHLYVPAPGDFRPLDRRLPRPDSVRQRIIADVAAHPDTPATETAARLGIGETHAMAQMLKLCQQARLVRRRDGGPWIYRSAEDMA